MPDFCVYRTLKDQDDARNHEFIDDVFMKVLDNGILVALIAPAGQLKRAWAVGGWVRVEEIQEFGDPK